MQNSDKISEYLYFGYLIKTVNYELLKLNSDHAFLKSKHHSDEELSVVFDKTICNSFPDGEEFDRCIIPLSGGWDSRLLLGAALEKYSKNKIIAVTYGCPGQLDYELGKLVAREVGIKHVAIDLDKEKLTWDRLVASVRLSPWTYTPDNYYNQLVLDAVVASDSDILISGFMGDPLTGGHIGKSKTTKEANATFVKKQRKIKNFDLSNDKYLPQVPLCNFKIEESPFDFDERYDIAIRQVNCIAPIVTFNDSFNSWHASSRERDKYPNIIMPFSDMNWVEFWSSNSKENKKGQRQYLDLLKLRYPYLYELPSKATYGSSVSDSHKFYYLIRKYFSKINIGLNRYFPKYFNKYKGPINYIDYDSAFRNRDDYKKILTFSIEYLEAEDVVPWLNLALMKAEHDGRKADYGDVFVVLIGLAVNLFVERN